MPTRAPTSDADTRAGLAAIIDSLKPAAIITFGPEGAYGHIDHIAISQLTAMLSYSSTT